MNKLHYKPFYVLLLMGVCHFMALSLAIAQPSEETKPVRVRTLPNLMIRSESDANRNTVNLVIDRLGWPRNQLDTNLCFANATADALAYYSGKKVSAFSVAIRNFQIRKGLDYIFFSPAAALAQQFTDDSRFMIGLASSAMKSSMRYTLCPDDQRGMSTYKDIDLKRLWDVYDKYRAYYGPTAPTHLYDQLKELLEKIAPSLDAHAFIDKLSPFKPLDHALGDWMDTQCDVRIDELNGYSVQGNEFSLFKSRTVLEKLDFALENNQIAVVHYDTKVFSGETPRLRQAYIGFHVSTIVARMRSGNESFYLLRNTWGGSCGDDFSDSISRRCTRGHVWLSADEVSRYVTSVAYYHK